MHRSVICAFASAISFARGFKDGSPFFLSSTAELLVPSLQNIASASSVFNSVASQLETCPSDHYVIISQPSVHSTDFASKQNTPHLRQMVIGDDKHIRSSLAVRDVVGTIDVDQLAQIIKGKCGAEMLRVDAATKDSDIANNTRPRIIQIDFPALPKERSKRELKLTENDVLLSSILSLLPSSKYTVIYTTTPLNPATAVPSPHNLKNSDNEPEPTYQMDTTLFESPLHLDLKRDLSSTTSKRDSSDEGPVLPSRPLFERYSFLSPGLFMGILVTLILLSILYVGISAIAGLQVTYAAFDKEMGPTAQKKAQ